MYQKLILVGYLGKDPEMRYTPSGEAVTNFSLATNRQWTNNAGEKVKETAWFRVAAWGKQAETCNQYLKKGSKALVEGRLVVDPKTGGPKVFTTRDGGAGAAFDVTAETVRFLSSAGEGEGGGQERQAAGQGDFSESNAEDIPF